MNIYYTNQGKKGSITRLEDSEKLVNGCLVFYRTCLAEMTYKFTALKIGDYMFANTGTEEGYEFGKSEIESVSESGGDGEDEGDFHDAFPNLVYGENMFLGSSIKKIEQDFPNLMIGNHMFKDCTKLERFDYELKDGEEPTPHSEGSSNWQIKGLDKLTNAYLMFANTKITSFYRDLPSLTDGSWMFDSITTLTNVDTYDEQSGEEMEILKGRDGYDKLIQGGHMFSGTSIISFYRDLPSLSVGDSMFSASKIKVFANGDVDKLTDATNMFMGCGQLTTFYSSMSSLETQVDMFTGCTNLETFYCDLSSLVSGKEMFKDFSKLTTFYSDLSSLTDSSSMFEGCIALQNFDAKLDKVVTADKMFHNCGSLTGFYNNLGECTSATDIFNGCSSLQNVQSDFSKIQTADGMFKTCVSLENFKSDLKSATSADEAFSDCTSLKIFDCNMEKITKGDEMFSKCENLTNFTSNLSSLTSANEMFSSCKKLETFDASMSSLSDGTEMFYKCTALTSFKSDLSNLETMTSMFDTCKKLSSFDSSPTLNAVTNADFAFYECYELPTFDYSEMNALVSAKSMFYGCKLLDNVKTSFPKLENAQSMFWNCDSLKSIGTKVDNQNTNENQTEADNQFISVKNGKQMFAACSSLQSFELNLPSLEDAQNMFYGCTTLTTLTNVNLKNLYTGLGMFKDSKLDKDSCVALGYALSANEATWPDIIVNSKGEEFGNGIHIGANSQLKTDTDVIEKLGNLTENGGKWLGYINNKGGSRITVQVFWND